MKFILCKHSLCSLVFLFSTYAAGDVTLERVGSGLQAPVQVVAAPGETGKLFVVEQEGRVRVLENGALAKESFLDIRSNVASGGEMGLLSIAFHPEYQKNKRFFLNYTARRPKLKTIIAEYKVGHPKENVLLEIDQPYDNHNGGLSMFGPDGYLYIGTGDGGSGGDPQNYSQNKNSLLGKMLRLDVRKEGKYAVPASNPFAQGGGRPEIYAWGLRNPWRFSFDSKNGTLFAADVGQNLWEEIDVIERGGNYGWRIMEGTHCFNPRVNCRQDGLTLPIYEYPHEEGISVTGGYVYRGKKIPELEGKYIYADFQSGNIWSLGYDPQSKKAGPNKQLLKVDFLISSFGEDAEGELLIVNYTGEILRLKNK